MPKQHPWVLCICLLYKWHWHTTTFIAPWGVFPHADLLGDIVQLSIDRKVAGYGGSQVDRATYHFRCPRMLLVFVRLMGEAKLPVGLGERVLESRRCQRCVICKHQLSDKGPPYWQSHVLQIK